MPRGRSTSFDRRKKLMWKRVLVSFGVGMLVAFIGVGVWYGTRHASVTIDEVVVSGGETVSHGVVEEVVWRELEGAYIFLVPKTFVYTYPRERIASAIEALPRVEYALIERDGRNTLSVSFSEYTPFALWCAHGEGACMLINEAGYAFDTAPPIKGGTLLRYIHNEHTPERGAHILSEEEIRSTQHVAENLFDHFNMRVYAVEYTRDGDFIYRIAGNGHILVNGAVAVEDTFDTLDAVFRSSDFSHLTTERFEYIDVRFDKTVYVQPYQEEIIEDVATTTES